jgi:hypothetical protein
VDNRAGGVCTAEQLRKPCLRVDVACVQESILSAVFIPTYVVSCMLAVAPACGLRADAYRVLTGYSQGTHRYLRVDFARVHTAPLLVQLWQQRILAGIQPISHRQVPLVHEPPDERRVK